MKAINKFLFVFSILAFSVLAQAEGVSQEDIERGNNPSSVTDSGTGH
ncbi:MULTISPECIES: hypothetical protein [unclassified Marinobacter]|nr:MULTISPECIES: hypothetical protein [unclassified Marinobacter]MDO6442311.1 hypothetical protein [Marinobacter sp. 2_MG-2023]MDO6824919.1 hypothetical protein [Marinobacter sp. 1_MG-2023]